MSTTSLKLPEDLKERAASAAQELGLSTHAFMVEAIRLATEQTEIRAQFVAEALAARAEMLESGTGYEANDVRTYLRKRVQDKAAPRPATKTWRE
ncbi:CopG family ribbon-helix-helix protein [Pseudoduganella sp. OTU4001]|uniref:CopG family ribbon-helix-helix protein n=1 Tax=Pseudoduganella sp. OTU4001 TaxID=3043854 RepID=UPI00313B3F10